MKEELDNGSLIRRDKGVNEKTHTMSESGGKR